MLNWWRYVSFILMLEALRECFCSGYTCRLPLLVVSASCSNVLSCETVLVKYSRILKVDAFGVND